MSRAGRPSFSRALDVWMNGELVGRWTYAQHRGHSFSYAESWLGNERLGRPLSLSMPLAPRRYAGEVVENYFDNLLPDSAAIRRRLATRYGVAAQPFALLEQIGKDCVGAVQLLPADSPAPKVNRIEAKPLSKSEVAALLDQQVAGRPASADDDGELRISLAGAQEKTALLRHNGRWCRPLGATPTTHILKLPMGEVGGVRADFSTSVENEWLCARLAEAYGLPVASCEMERFGAYKVLVVERFDRKRLDGWWARLPQEDFCQVYGVSPEAKYEERDGPGMARILDTLRGSDDAAGDRERFVASQLLFWLLAAPNGHAKNFSIALGAHGGFRLTPLYDVMSAWPVIGRGPRQLQWQKVKLAMAVRSKNAHYRVAEIQRRHWNEAARQNALGVDFEDVIERFVDITPAAIARVEKQLPAGFPASLAGAIFEGVRQQVRRLAKPGGGGRQGA